MSKSRKFRTTKLSFQEDDEDPVASAKQQAPKAAKTSMLSFGDDEEGPITSGKKKKDAPQASKFYQADLKVRDGSAAASTHRSTAGEDLHAVRSMPQPTAAIGKPLTGHALQQRWCSSI